MSEVEPIPQSAPGAAYLEHRGEIDAAVERVLSSGRYILGSEVAGFESEFANYLGIDQAIGVANGTDALELALRAAGVGPGDAVFTVAHTAVATVVAIERAGALPILVDIDPDTYTMDPRSLEEAVRSAALPRGVRARAVVPVHLYGQLADMPAILSIANAAGLRVVEDCAQAHGARLHGRPAGTWGSAASFSFYPTKNLGAFGDGGTVVTADETIAERVRELRQYGWRERDVSAITGVNSRLDEVQAAILRVRLRHLDSENAMRRAIADRYHALLAPTEVQLPAVRRGGEHVFHQYVIRASRRDEIAAALAGRGIETAIHYPVPVHRQPAYVGRLPGADALGATERIADSILSLPMFPYLTDRAIERVAAAVLGWARQADAIA